MIIIYVQTIRVLGQRPIYKWSVEDETFIDEPVVLAYGDSYYKWNAKRAARRAAKRWVNGETQPINEIYRERFEENAS